MPAFAQTASCQGIRLNTASPTDKGQFSKNRKSQPKLPQHVNIPTRASHPVPNCACPGPSKRPRSASPCYDSFSHRRMATSAGLRRISRRRCCAHRRSARSARSLSRAARSAYASRKRSAMWTTGASLASCRSSQRDASSSPASERASESGDLFKPVGRPCPGRQHNTTQRANGDRRGGR
jgi:hypothetical protein